MSVPYRRYAEIYDRTGQDRFGARLAEITLELLAARSVPIDRAVDLATGTGTAAFTLAETGIEVIAIDRSREMIRAARRKDLRDEIDWRVGELERFIIEAPVDLVTCFFDSINYLLDRESLLVCFTAVAAALHPGGWFAFDVNTLGRFATDWNGSTQIAFDTEDLFCIFRSEYDPETHISPLFLTVFEREGNRWQRWDEEHLERGYPIAELTELLQLAGFETVATYAFSEIAREISGPADDLSERAIFLARRNG
jgi:SAM-dependent methyltransferase